MENSFNFDEAKRLDSFLENLIEQNEFTVDNSLAIINPIKRNPVIEFSNFDKSMDLIKPYIYITQLSGSKYHLSANEKTTSFIKNGGFKEIYWEQRIRNKSNSEKEILEFKQLKSNVKLLEKQNRYFSTNQIITIITVVCTLITIGFTIYTLNN